MYHSPLCSPKSPRVPLVSKVLRAQSPLKLSHPRPVAFVWTSLSHNPQLHKVMGPDGALLHAGAATLEQVDLLTLHRRLGHVSVSAIRNLIWNNIVAGLQLLDDTSPFFCESCEYAKTTRKPINKERQAAPANAFGDEIHSDLWGPSPIPTIGGRK